MKYLDSIAILQYSITIEQAAQSDKSFYRYYMDSVVAKNPASFTTVPVFLGYTGYSAPMSWEQFRNRVSAKNLDEIINFTKKYGYLSPKRMKSLMLPDHFSTITFIISEDSRDKELKRLFKKEYKAGNIPESEYEFFKFIVERKKVLTNYDVKQLDKKGIKLSAGAPKG